MKKPLSHLLISLLLVLAVAGCSTPEEKAEKYYQRGMSLIESDPEKAKLEFQNALQIKKTMTKAMYGLALTTERQGDMKATFALMNEVLNQDPKHIEALVKVGQIFLAGGKLDLAVDRSNKALAIDKNNVPAITLRAAILLKTNDAKGAIEYANLALEKDPKNQDAYVVLATERLAAKDETKALELLNKALTLNEKNLAVQLIKIRTLETMSDLKGAEATYKKVITLFPETTFAKKNYALFLLKYNRRDEAEQQLRNIAETNPTNTLAKLDVVKFVIASKGTAKGQAELENFVKKEPENYELAYELVNLYRLQKKSAEEDKLLNQIAAGAKEKADSYKAKSLIAQKLLREGKKTEATKVIAEILEEDKTNQLALTLRAGIEMDENNFDAAISDLRTVQRDSPDAAGASYMLAMAHERAGQPELAEEQFQKAFNSSKSSSTYGIPYAQFLTRRKQPDRAEKVLESMIEANPTDDSITRYLAQSKIARGDIAGAQALADKAKNKTNATAIGDQILGDISASKKDFNQSINAYKRAQAASPNDARPLVEVVRAYLQAGKNKEAIEYVNEIVAKKPDNVDAKLMLAQLYITNGDNPKGMQAYKDVIQLQPKAVIAYQQLAMVQQSLKLNTEAENTIINGLTIAPNDFTLKLTQASLFENTHRFEDSIKVYQELLVAQPKSKVVANNLASLLLDNRKDAASIKQAYELAAPLKGSDLPQYLDTFGWASHKVGKNDEALKAINTAAEKMPGVSVFHYHLGKIYMAQNENAKAKVELEKSIKYFIDKKHEQTFEQKDDAAELLKTL
jgi:cellulose synthase operon protein C